MWGTAEFLTYSWKSGYVGGRFESNRHAWWKYDKNGNLIISVDHVITDGVVNNEFRVWEDVIAEDTTLTDYNWSTVIANPTTAPTGPSAGNYNAPDVPWLDVLSGTDIKKIYMQNQIAPVNPNGWFSTQVNTTTTGSQNYCNLEEFEGSGADMQHATSLADMFRGDIKLKRVSTGLAGWNNMSHATSLSGMFAGCKALAEIVGLDNWDVSHITDFSSMFDMSQHLEATGVLGNDALVQMGNWNIGANVTGSITMKDMFKDLQGITSLTGLAAWDTSKVTDFSGMFSSSKNHKGTVYEYKDGKLNMTIGDKGSMLLDASVVTLWDTSAATTFANMFANAIRLEKVNISSWNMHDKTATDMFLNCAGLNEITLGVNNILDDTAFGPDMFFIETVPTRANGGTHTDVNVYWRSNVDINPDNNKLTYNGVTWQYGNIGGTWFAQDANRPTGNDFTGANIWSGSTSNLLALYPAPIAPGVQAHKAPAAVTTYKWDDSCYAGVFDSSIAQDSTTGLYYYNSWWRYYKKGDLDKTLVMGTIANAGNHVVTEKNESHKDNGTNNLPWAKYPGANIVANVEHIKTGAVLHEDGTITFDSLLGQISPTNPEGWFYDHNNLKDFDGAGFDTSQATSLSYFLAGCEKLETISNMGGWDVSGITDFSHMFHGDVKLKDISTLSTWVLKNTPGGVNMAYMFADTGITDPGALATNGTYWNVGRVDNMEGMFAGCKEMTTQETIKNWDISRVQTMAGMFRNCAALTTVDLSRWAMKSAGGLTHIGNLNVDGMFEGCSKLGQLTVGESSMLTNTAFNNSLANRGPTDTETGGMWELVKANGVDLPRTSHTTDFLPEGTALWFGSTGSLAERYTTISSVPGAALTYVWRDDMIGERFKSNPYAWWIYDKGIKLDKDGNPVLDSNKNPVKAGHLVMGLDTGADATDYCRSPEQQTQTYGSLVTEGQDDTTALSASDLPWLFRTFTVSESDSVNNVSKDYTPVDRSSIVKVTTQGGIDVRFPANWFRGYANLAYFDGSGMDTSQATNLSNMFAGDVKLADFVTSAYRWNTSNVTNMSGFLSGTALTNLDMLSTSGANGFNVSNVKDLSYAFNGMTSLTDISGLANWQINSSQYAPVNMSYMLYGDTKLLSAVPLQDWTVDYADLSYAFGGNVAMHSADLSRWDMRNATVNGLFENNKVIGDASKGGYLRLGKFSKLMLTGLADISTRAAKTGMWVRDTSSGTVIDWFGTSNALMDMYKDGSTGVGNAILVPSYLDYIWDDSRLGGRFGSNVNDWWMFFIKDSTYNGEPMRKGTLLLGADQTASNRVVTETANALPWLDDASTPEVDPIVTRDQVWYIKTKYDIAPSNPAEWFKDYVNNVSFDGSGMHITNTVTSLAGMFKNQPKLHTVTGLDSWDVSNVTSLKEFFHGDERLTNISGMDAWASKTGKVEDMSGMFYNNDGLVNTNLNQFANWNVGNVRDMSYLLYDADGITDLDALAGWRPGRVEDLSHAFESMNELTNVNGLRDWAPASSSATTSLKLAYLFAGCTKLTSIEPITGSSANIGANHWNVDKVTDFSYMLYNIADASDKMTITSIDLSQWDMRSNTYRNGNILLTNMLQLSSNAYTDAKDPKDTNFVSFTFGPNTLLYKDSTNNAGLANTPLLTLADGVWIKNTNALGQATSVGNSDDLMIWYDTSVNVPSDITTYTFDPTHLGSVMADNRNIWWTVAKKDTTSVADASVEDKANLLRIGLIGNSKSHATSMLGPNLPWKQALGSVSFWNNVIGFATDGTNGNVAPTTISQWFASTPAAFTSFDGTYLDTSNVTSFYQAFYNATKLATVTGTGNWNTNKCVNFDSMFQGCSVLKELDMSNWKVRGNAAGANASITNMFAGMEYITIIHIGPGMVLQGTGFTEIAAVGPDMSGYWYKDGTRKADRYGKTADLANTHYAAASCDTTGIHTYRWIYGGEFASNGNAWWRYDHETQTMSMGLYNYAASANHIVTEYGNSLPWLSASGSKSMPITEVKHIVTNFGATGDDGVVCNGGNGLRPRDLTSWFAGFTSVEDFDGRGLWVDRTGFFTSTFSGDAKLKKIDISTWIMVSSQRYNVKNSTSLGNGIWPNMTDFLAGATSISQIVAGNQIYLMGSNIARTDGLWATGEFTYDNEYTAADTLWFDTTAHLFTDTTCRYMNSTSTAAATGRGLGTVTWTFVPGTGAPFDDNPEATWIMADEDVELSPTTTLHKNTLYVGVRPTAANKTTAGFEMWAPWASCDFEEVRTFGGLKPLNMKYWFTNNFLTTEQTKTWGFSKYVASDTYYSPSADGTYMRVTDYDHGDTTGIYKWGYYFEAGKTYEFMYDYKITTSGSGFTSGCYIRFGFGQSVDYNACLYYTNLSPYQSNWKTEHFSFTARSTGNHTMNFGFDLLGKNNYATFYWKNMMLINKDSRLKNFDGTGFDTSACTDFSYMLYKRGNLESVDIHNWDMRNGGNFTYMFHEDDKMTRLDLGPLTSFGNSAYIQSSTWGQNEGYTGGTSQSWTITATGGDPITVYFDPKSFTEKNFDTIKIWENVTTANPTANGSKYKLSGNAMAGVTYTFKDMQNIVITFNSDASGNKAGFKAYINGGKVTAVTNNAVYANTDNNIGVFGPQPAGVLEGNGAWLEYGRPGPYPKDDLTRQDGDWFGNYNDLIKHTYSTKGKYTYIWDPNFMGGRLAGNDHLWWYYTEPGHTRTDNGYVVKPNSLVIGADPGYTPQNLTVDIDRATTMLPWEKIVPAGVVKHVATMGQWRALTLNQWFSSNKEYLIENLYDPHSWTANNLDEEARDKGTFTMKDENGDGSFNTVASFNLTAGTTYYFHYSYYWDARDLNLLNVAAGNATAQATLSIERGGTETRKGDVVFSANLLANRVGEECLYENWVSLRPGYSGEYKIWLRLPGNKSFELNPATLHLDGLSLLSPRNATSSTSGLQSAGTVAGKYEGYPTKTIPVYVTSDGHSFEDFDELSDYLAANPGITYTTSSRLEYSPTINTSNYTKYYYPSDFFRNLETFDGSGIYMDDCRSIGGLFENTTGLKEMNIRGWSLDPTKITTDKALSSLVNLERIIVDNGTSLTTDPSFIAQIPKHNNGAWVAQSVTEDADNPKLDSGSNRVFEGMAVLNTSPTTSTNKSLENLYAYTNGGNDHGIVTWEFGYGTFINFEPNRNDAEGYIPSAFLKGGETFSFTKDPDGTLWIDFPNGDRYPAYTMDGYVLRYWNTVANPPTNKHGVPTQGQEVTWGYSYTAPNVGDDDAVSITFYAQWYRDADVTVKFVVDTDGAGTGTTPDSNVGADADITTGYLEVTGKKVGDTFQLFDGTTIGTMIYDPAEGYVLDMASFEEFKRPGYDLVGWSFYLRHINEDGTIEGHTYTIKFDEDKDHTTRLFIPYGADEADTLFIDTFYALWAPHRGYSVQYVSTPSAYTPDMRTDLTWTDANLLPTDGDKVTRLGYKVAGWYALDKDGNRITFADGSNLITTANAAHIRIRDIALSADVADVITLYVEWAEGDIVLEFNADTDAGRVSMPVQEVPLSDATAVKNVTAIVNKGYHFDGWTNDRDGTVFTDFLLTADQIRQIAFDAVTGHWLPTVFTAHFAPNEYTIKFAPGEGGQGSMPDQTATYGVGFIVPTAGDTTTFYRDGYVFTGWMTNELYSDSNPSTPRFIHAGDNITDFLSTHNGTIILTAQWEPMTIQVTWIAGKGGMVAVAGDEGNKAQTVTREYTTVTVALDRVRAIANLGYRFTGWHITGSDEVLSTSALLERILADGTMWPAEQSFTATFEPITYKIVFQHYVDNDGQPVATGTMPGELTKTYDTPLELPYNYDEHGYDLLTRLGYVFSGWRTLDGKTVFDEGGFMNIDLSAVDGDTVFLYDHWVPSKYTVTFYRGTDNAVGTMAVQTFTYDLAQALSKNQYIRNGHRFVGWAKSLYGGIDYTDEEFVKNLGMDGDNIVLYARWEKVEAYNVFFELDEKCTGMATIHMPNDYDPNIGIMVRQDFFVPDDQVPFFSQTQEQIDADYQLAYWRYSIQHEDGTVDTGITQDVRKIAVTGVMLFTAVYTYGRTYIVLYEQGEHGTFPSADNKTYFVELPPSVSTNPTYVPQYGNTPAGGALDPTYFDTNSSNPKNIGKPKGTPGWQFLGWMWQDDDGTRHYNFDYYDDLGNLVKSAEEFPSVITNRSYTFTAMWAPSEVTVYLGTNGGEWIRNPGDPGLAHPDEAGEFTLTAGNDFAMAVQNTGRAIILPSHVNIMEREGYSFMGYTSSPGGEVIWAAGDTIIATYGLHIYAVWQKLTYTVHFNSLGGTSVADKKGVGWADRNLLAGVATPKKNGYTFDGWYIIDPNADLVDDSIHKVSNPSMYSTIARYNGLTDLTALEPGVTLYAKWLENVYEIQYKAAQIDKFGNFIDTNGGTVTVKKETVRIITQVEAPNGSAARTGTGFHFVGWYDVNGNKVSSAYEFRPNKGDYNLTGEFWGDPNHSIYYAVFEPNTYMVEFVVNGGIGRIEALEMNYGEARYLPLNNGQMARVGFVFVGWATNPDGSGVRYDDGAQIMNLTGINGARIPLYAIWKGLEFTLTLDKNGGMPNPWDGVAKPPVTYNADGNVEYPMVAGSTIRLPDTHTFVRAGYTMDGWVTKPMGDDLHRSGQHLPDARRQRGALRPLGAQHLHYPLPARCAGRGGRRGHGGHHRHL